MVQITPAATALIVRESSNHRIEVLLLKRSTKLIFAADCWVFPGGRVDPEDGPLTNEHIQSTAKITAAREAREEAGISIDPMSMSHFCHWTTPLGPSRRFSTWFFHCLHHDADHEIIIDNSEIVDHIWITPAQALEQMKARNLFLLPPTFINLERIRHAKKYEDVVTEFSRTGIITARPVTDSHDGLFYSLYKGDAGYKTTDITRTSSLHRLIMNPSSGEYQFLYESCDEPPVNGGLV